MHNICMRKFASASLQTLLQEKCRGGGLKGEAVHLTVWGSLLRAFWLKNLSAGKYLVPYMDGESR